MNFKKFALELASWTLALVFALVIFVASFADAQDTQNTLDKVPQGNYISCIEVRKGVSVCTLNTKSMPDFKVSIPTKIFNKH